jgi:hypothetical protein
MRLFGIFSAPLFVYAVILSSQPSSPTLQASTLLPAENEQSKVNKTGGKDDNEDSKLERWFVYRDSDSKENHGHWTNVMQGDLLLALGLADKVDPAFGETCVKATIKFQAPNWCGVAVACEPDYWGEKSSDTAFNLKKAKKLIFYARGEKGGESIQVKVAIAGDKPFGDSAKVAPATPWLTLKKNWQRYELTIDPMRTNLERVVTPFCFVTDKAHNRGEEISFYLDHIYYIMEGK